MRLWIALPCAVVSHGHLLFVGWGVFVWFCGVCVCMWVCVLCVFEHLFVCVCMWVFDLWELAFVTSNVVREAVGLGG